MQYMFSKFKSKVLKGDMFQRVNLSIFYSTGLYRTEFDSNTYGMEHVFRCTLLTLEALDRSLLSVLDPMH